MAVQGHKNTKLFIQENTLQNCSKMLCRRFNKTHENKIVKLLVLVYSKLKQKPRILFLCMSKIQLTNSLPPPN